MVVWYWSCAAWLVTTLDQDLSHTTQHNHTISPLPPSLPPVIDSLYFALNQATDDKKFTMSHKTWSSRQQMSLRWKCYKTWQHNMIIFLWHFLFSVALNPALDIQDIIPPVNIVKPTVNVPTVSVPTSSWKPDQWATWPFITITGVSGRYAALGAGLQHSLLQIPHQRFLLYRNA